MPVELEAEERLGEGFSLDFLPIPGVDLASLHGAGVP
jgi:hypothetical protein